MITIKETFETLSRQDQAKLMYARENGISQMILTGKEDFIGVYLPKSKNREILLETGDWCVGKLRSGQDA